MAIHWFPGHMAKTRREIAESLRQVDGVVNMVDARLPQSSQNPLLAQLAGAKPVILVLAKADLADPAVTAGWADQGLAVSLKDNRDKKKLLAYIEGSLDAKARKRFPRPWRVMVVGIPNVGKSTLINLLAGRRSAKVGDRPGITRARQWIKISAQLEMLDTPGILWPKIEEEQTAFKLAVAGCIRDEVLPVVDIAQWLLDFLSAHYPANLVERYGGADLAAIARKGGLLKKGGVPDWEGAARYLLKDFRSGTLGRITLDR